jgi:hypothetical protein
MVILLAVVGIAVPFRGLLLVLHVDDHQASLQMSDAARDRASSQTYNGDVCGMR